VSLVSLHGVGEGQHGGARGRGSGAVDSGEGGRKGKVARPGEPPQTAGPVRAKRSDGCCAIWTES
jgi:hypothetical protein